jgi:carboxyl-terminal processing protease
MTARIGSSVKVEFDTADGQRLSTQFEIHETEQQKTSAQVIVGPKGEKILYVSLPEFQLSSMNEFDDAIDKVLKDNPNTNMPMILDLRGNVGGSIKSELYFASEFEKDGVAFQKVMRDGKGETKSDMPIYNLPDGDGSGDGQRTKYLRSAPVVVLLDDGSRSAAEGVTISLAAHGRLTAIVGNDSFGKGRIYDDYQIGKGHLRISIGMLLSPTGESWDEKGVKPTIPVERSRDPNAPDNQLNAAIAAIEKALHY